jgi:AcrR family transcriptional regulator
MPEKTAREPASGLRADARRNLEKLRAAAAETFSERGLDMPLEEIAARAGVSVGTVYNRLGSRDALIDFAIGDHAAKLVAAAVEKAEAITDPWGRFACFIEEMCAIQASDLAFNDVMSRRRPEAEQISAVCDDALAHVGQYLEQAQRAGAVRPDVTLEDIFLIFWSNANLVRETRTVAPDAWRRSLAITLDGLRTEAAVRPLPHGQAADGGSQQSTTPRPRKRTRRHSSD